MRAAAAALPAVSTAVIAQVTDCVQELAGLAGDGCLVESAHGRLLAHHLVGTDIDPLLLSALVSGSLIGFHAATASRRTTGLLPSGPVVEATLAGRPVLQVALHSGAVWLLPTRPVPLEALRGPVERLAALLACTTSAPESSCLDGGRMPSELAGCERLWVARVIADAGPDALLLALAPTAAALVVRPVRCGRQVYLVVGGGRRATPRAVQQAVLGLCRAAGSQLGTTVTAGLSGVSEAADLAGARSQADAAVSAAAPGTCTPLEQVRAMLTVHRLVANLPTLDLGLDPLQRLLDYDTRRDTDFAASLLAWLNTFGDVARAAADLGLHPNTLRYRLRRVREILDVDLQEDAACRAVVHLQLLGAGPTPLPA